MFIHDFCFVYDRYMIISVKTEVRRFYNVIYTYNICKVKTLCNVLALYIIVNRYKS